MLLEKFRKHKTKIRECLHITAACGLLSTDGNQLGDFGSLQLCVSSPVLDLTRAVEVSIRVRLE